ncbi:hypothetical protein [Roseomonas fluvialis]|uniref:Uncharacterized protein n=1 Tax=Roseomonas fluvialis TaxID=1750527 RepID=A0ABM7Y0P7_9PROT|nr:hypothetical protein [Roseomonas fluvialis]BDG71369.1 hypothetical protein Rmf_12980 [Roseomonas fluvialis]
MFFALLIVAVLLAVLVARLPRGAGRAFAAGAAVLALTAAAMVKLRAAHLPGHRPRPWRNP